MVTMDTRSKIRKLRKIFEPGNTSSFDLNQAHKTSQSLPRNPERTVNVLEDRSPGSNVFSKKSKIKKIFSFFRCYAGIKGRIN